MIFYCANQGRVLVDQAKVSFVLIGTGGLPYSSSQYEVLVILFDWTSLSEFPVETVRVGFMLILPQRFFFVDPERERCLLLLFFFESGEGELFEVVPFELRSILIQSGRDPY